MSGVTTSSLSLAWTLRNWVILDYEEANGLTVRPWAPFLSFQSLEPSPFTGLSRLDPVDLARRWKRIVKPKMKRTRIETPSGLDQQIGDDKERIYAWFLFSFPDLIIGHFSILVSHQYWRLTPFLFESRGNRDLWFVHENNGKETEKLQLHSVSRS